MKYRNSVISFEVGEVGITTTVSSRSAFRVKGKPAFANSSRLGMDAQWATPRKSTNEFSRMAPPSFAVGSWLAELGLRGTKSKLKLNVFPNGRMLAVGTKMERLRSVKSEPGANSASLRRSPLRYTRSAEPIATGSAFYRYVSFTLRFCVSPK